MLKKIINISLLTIITIATSESVLAQPYKTEILDNGVNILNTGENKPQNSANMTINDGKNKTNVEITSQPNLYNPNLTNLEITETSIKNTYLNIVKTNVLGVDCNQSVPSGFIVNQINSDGRINSVNVSNTPIYFDSNNVYSQLVSQVCKK